MFNAITEQELSDMFDISLEQFIEEANAGIIKCIANDEVKNMKIEKPWEEFFCDKCNHCFDEDMCKAYMLGMSYAYCPQIRECEKFKEKND